MVTITRLPGGATVAVRQPVDGRFRAKLKPGRYLLSASGTCLSGSPVRVKVRRGLFARAALELQQGVCAA